MALMLGPDPVTPLTQHLPGLGGRPGSPAPTARRAQHRRPAAQACCRGQEGPRGLQARPHGARLGAGWSCLQDDLSTLEPETFPEIPSCCEFVASQLPRLLPLTRRAGSRGPGPRGDLPGPRCGRHGLSLSSSPRPRQVLALPAAHTLHGGALPGRGAEVRERGGRDGHRHGLALRGREAQREEAGGGAHGGGAAPVASPGAAGLLFVRLCLEAQPRNFPERRLSPAPRALGAPRDASPQQRREAFLPTEPGLQTHTLTPAWQPRDRRRRRVHTHSRGSQAHSAVPGCREDSGLRRSPNPGDTRTRK
nr:uncharacterized protein LOC105866383 [Microcebus murinus]